MALQHAIHCERVADIINIRYALAYFHSSDYTDVNQVRIGFHNVAFLIFTTWKIWLQGIAIGIIFSINLMKFILFSI